MSLIPNDILILRSEGKRGMYIYVDSEGSIMARGQETWLQIRHDYNQDDTDTLKKKLK